MSLVDQQVHLQNLVLLLKIHKYRGFHEGHHFISIALEVDGVFKCDMNCFIKECICLFHDR
jgi:hypothetical protein